MICAVQLYNYISRVLSKKEFLIVSSRAASNFPSEKFALHSRTRSPSEPGPLALRETLSEKIRNSFTVISLLLLLCAPSVQGGQNEILILGEELAPSQLSSFVNILSIQRTEQSKSVADFLKTQKGVIIKSESSSGSLTTANIRGISEKAEHVLVLMDGIRLNSAQGGGVDLSRIPLSQVEKIEIIRGGESALYGSDAIGGVINIVTLKNKPQLSYNFSKNSFDTTHFNDHKLTLTMGQKWKSLHMLLNIHSQKDKSDYVYTHPLTHQKEKRINNQFQSKGFLAKSLWEVTPHTVFSLTQEFLWAHQHVPGPIIWPSDGIKKDYRFLATLDGTFSLPQQHTLTVRLPYRQDFLKYAVETYEATHKNFHLEPTLSYAFPLGSRHLVTALAQGNMDFIQSDAMPSRPQRTALAAVLKDNFYVHPSLLFIPVVRFERSNIYTAVTPKIGTTYEPFSKFYIKSNLSHNFRAPSFSELYWQDPYYTGNPLLKPETSWSEDIGFSTTFPFLNTKIENTLFRSDIKNLISKKDITDQVSTVENLDQRALWGNELSLEADLPFFLNSHTALNYTWLNKLFPHRPQHLVNSSFQVQFNAFKISLDHQFLSSVLTQTVSRPKLSPVHLLGMGASYELSPALTVTAHADNLLDKAYERIAYYPMPGRTFNVSISGAL